MLNSQFSVIFSWEFCEFSVLKNSFHPHIQRIVLHRCLYIPLLQVKNCFAMYQLVVHFWWQPWEMEHRWYLHHFLLRHQTQYLICLTGNICAQREKFENTVLRPLNFCFTTLPAGTFVLRPSPFKLLLYGPPHFRVILFYGPPLGIWSPPRRLINDNPLSQKNFWDKILI